MIKWKSKPGLYSIDRMNILTSILLLFEEKTREKIF